ncbi:YcjX family protein [Thiomicrorhabdus sp.]|uniref:YcjX family protein n=1 Tax=Thiomicrorhabdus sp. TaxID=2039724 RepID=UPI0029C9AE7B|nr:YcjX family protein [Thiomicrorhabdus sp.]
MSRFVNKFYKAFDTLVDTGAQSLENLFSRDVHHVIITGLSRSGKSMFFTTLMSLLSQRSQQTFDNLPLLRSLPKELIQSVELRPIEGEALFPLDRNLQKLQSRQWPESTEQIYGFELVLTTKPLNAISKLLRKSNQIIFRFHDYPGEWLTDLPMLHKEFVAWSDSAWSQQLNPPQKHYAADWHAFVESYDFDLLPNEELVGNYMQQYRSYLIAAKSKGITLLQPGSMLIPSPKFNWEKNGFAPLPSRIASDPEHPWTLLFQKNFEHFKKIWLAPLQESYFSKADKQIVMLDLHQGLSHSRAHLNQLKETLSNLASSFVYGADKWYKPKILFRHEISKVAFVATKIDLIPNSQHENFLHLLQDITSGIRAHLREKEVEFQHFLISAMQTTDPGSCENCLRFTNPDGDYEEWEFESIPDQLKALDPEQNYPAINTMVPKDVLARMNHAQGIDRLIEYLIK